MEVKQISTSSSKQTAKLQRRRRKAERINAAVRQAEYYADKTPSEMFKIFLDFMEMLEIMRKAEIVKSN